MHNPIIFPVELDVPNQKTIDYFLTQVNTLPRENFEHSHISVEMHKWLDNMTLMEKSLISSLHINSGFLNDDNIYQLLKSQFCFDGQDQKLFDKYLPNPTDKMWVFAQRNKRYQDGKYIGISPTPTNWSLFKRGINLIYTLPGNTWTFKYYNLKNQENKTKQFSVHSYDELELIEEIQIPENSWYYIDFSQHYFTEEIWHNQVDRFMLVLR